MLDLALLGNEGALTVFIMLARPHLNASFDREDIDLIKTVTNPCLQEETAPDTYAVGVLS